MEEVILVNENDEVIGTMEKLLAHETASLHRAISVFIFNSKNELLLQQRAKHKYHSGGLWSNTACSHPRLNEDSIDAATRRLKEEMGMHTELDFKFKFKYKSKMPNGLVEHEVDHIFFGVSDELPIVNPEEVEDYKYIKLEILIDDASKHPENYTSWFLKLLKRVSEEMPKSLNS
jgi:isopentenyl-diphosphate delta-isomerase